jgi:hypothetical protein
LSDEREQSAHEKQEAPIEVAGVVRGHRETPVCRQREPMGSVLAGEHSDVTIVSSRDRSGGRRRRFSPLNVLGEQPQLQGRFGERWRTIEPLSPSALVVWAAWCEQQGDIPRGAALEDVGEEVTGSGCFAALLGRPGEATRCRC